MNRYNPLVAPDPEEWLAMDSDARTILIEDYHRRKRIRMPNVHLHALFQTIVENQVAMGDETPAADKLQELMREDMDRHEALHAIASVVARWYYYLMRGDLKEDGNAWYNRELKLLTKQRWIDSMGDEE